MNVFEQYKPLDMPLDGALQCTDICSNLEVFNEETVNENLNVNGNTNPHKSKRHQELIKLEECMGEMEMQQRLLEKMVKFGENYAGNVPNQRSGLRKQLNEMQQELDQMKEKYGTLMGNVESISRSVSDKIQSYESKRLLLHEKLNGLRELCGSENNKNVIPSEMKKELEIKLEKQLDEIREKQNKANLLTESCTDLKSEIDSMNDEMAQLSSSSSCNGEKIAIEEEIETNQLAELTAKLEWTKEIKSVLEGLSGVTATDFQESSLVIKVEKENVLIQLNFDPESATLINAIVRKAKEDKKNGTGESQQEGDDDDDDDDDDEQNNQSTIKKNLAKFRKPYQKMIISHAVAKNDIRFLVREIRAVTYNNQVLTQELASLQARYPVSFVSDEIVVTLPESLVATFVITQEYPQSCARLVSLEAFNGWKPSLMEEFSSHVSQMQKEEPESFSTVSSLLEAIQAKIEQRKAEKSA